jgi:predicted GNAT family acetyltransferase
MPMPLDPEFRDNSAAAQYELRTNGGLAFLTYRESRRGFRILVHTEVPRELQGRGVGTRLVKAALDDARTHHHQVIPACEFVKSYLQRHPEYSDVLAAQEKPDPD